MSLSVATVDQTETVCDKESTVPAYGGKKDCRLACVSLQLKGLCRPGVYLFGAAGDSSCMFGSGAVEAW